MTLGIAASLALVLGLAGCGGGGGTDTDRPDGGGNDVTTDTPTTDTRPDTGPDDMTQTDGPPTDMTSPKGGQAEYRITALEVATPGEDQNTSFAGTVSTVLSLSISGAGKSFGIPQLNLAVSFSSVAAGASTIVTVCQADEEADGSFTCRADPAPVSAEGSFDAAGVLTTVPADFTFNVSAGDLGDIPLTLYEFTLSGQLDANAANGAGEPPGLLEDGMMSAKLAVADLCAVTIENAQIATFCQGATTLNLLDLIDGPTAMCGQDGSADYAGANPTCATGDKNPPDTTVTGGGMGYSITGSFSMQGAEVSQ